MDFYRRVSHFLKITRNTDYTVFSAGAVGMIAARCTCGSVMPGATGSLVLMRDYAAFMLSVLPCDTIKYRCGEERQAMLLSSKRVRPVFYLSGRADCARTPTHTPAEKDRVEKTTTTTQHANNKDDKQRTSSSVGL